MPVGGGIETYCVTGNGLVALLDTAAVHIELTALTPEVDPSSVRSTGSGLDDHELMIDTVHRVRAG